MIKRTTLAGAREDKLFFGQVREDPLAELRALELGPEDTVVAVTSGGCTALSVLAAGPARVVGVDLNVAQNHLTELKTVALARLSVTDAIRFIGGWHASKRTRRSWYKQLRNELSPGARAYWDARSKAVGAGVMTTGACEKLLKVIAKVVRRGVHSPATVNRLLSCSTLEEQRHLYDNKWNNRRWRGLFALLVNRVTFRKTFHPAFFQHVENPSFSKHFLDVCSRSLTEAPIKDNYFFHQMLTGHYPVGRESGLPPFLQTQGASAVKASTDRLELVDAAYGDYLATLPDQSVNAFTLSNIMEWNTPEEIEALFDQIVRTAAPGARVVYRNFVGWTEIPERLRDRLVEQPDRGAQAMEGERSGMQRRVVVATVS